MILKLASAHAFGVRFIYSGFTFMVFFSQLHSTPKERRFTVHFNGDFRGFADSERRIVSTYKMQAELLGARGDISFVCLREKVTETKKYQNPQRFIKAILAS